MTEIEAKPINPEQIEARHELKEFLTGHLTLAGATIDIADDQKTLVVQTPEIREDANLFTFKDNEDVKAFYDRCQRLGELRLDIEVPVLAAHLTNFDVEEFELKNLEDFRMYNFLSRVGEKIAKNTSTGKTSIDEINGERLGEELYPDCDIYVGDRRLEPPM